MEKTLGQKIKQRFIDSGFERILIYGDNDNHVVVGGQFLQNKAYWHVCFRKLSVWEGGGFALTLNQSGVSGQTQTFRMLDPDMLPKIIKTARYFASLS